MLQLTGKVAVVTGAGSGIGEAIAVLFARQGARVELLDVDEAAAHRTASRIREAGGDAEATRADVSTAADVEAAFAGAASRRGRIDILVNNAGIAHVGDVERTAEEDLDRLYRVNVKGLFLCSRAAIPVMLRGGGGVILNLASIAALIGVPERFAYSMTKGAVLSMTRSIAIDYMKKGIRCNCICPARVHTPFVDGYVTRNYPGPGGGGLPPALRVPAARTHGQGGGGGGPGPLPLLRRGVVHHRPGLSHRRRSAGHMKLIRFGAAGRERPGVLLAEGTRLDVSGLADDYDEAFFAHGGLERLGDWVRRNEKTIPRADAGTRLGPPIRRPSKIVCIGLNYRDHAAETGAEIPREPVIFFKSTTALVGPNDALVMPRGATKVDWEVELAVVIGKETRYVAEDRALEHVAGYALHNDYSERSFQLERGGQWVKGKSADTFAPLGPFLATRDEIADPQRLAMWLKVNGEIRQRCNTANMIFGVPPSSAT